MPFTPRERAVLDVYPRLGEAARRGLHAAERVAAREVEEAGARARRLVQAIRARRPKG